MTFAFSRFLCPETGTILPRWRPYLKNFLSERQLSIHVKKDDLNAIVNFMWITVRFHGIGQDLDKGRWPVSIYSYLRAYLQLLWFPWERFLKGSQLQSFEGLLAHISKWPFIMNSWRFSFLEGTSIFCWGLGYFPFFQTELNICIWNSCLVNEGFSDQ